jgi:hypothetical protein
MLVIPEACCWLFQKHVVGYSRSLLLVILEACCWLFQKPVVGYSRSQQQASGITNNRLLE